MNKAFNYDDLLGKPFKEGGKVDGFDCYTLAVEICKRAGCPIPEEQYTLLAFKENAEKRNNVLILKKETEYIKLDKPEPFCLVGFKLKGPFLTHIGVMIDQFRFIHIIRGRSVTIEKIDHWYWQSKLEGFYRYVN